MMLVTYSRCLYTVGYGEDVKAVLKSVVLNGNQPRFIMST